MSNESQPNNSIPIGRKENHFYIFNNESNLKRRQNNLKSRHWDDAGAWVGGPTNSSLFIVNDCNLLKEAKIQDGVYGILVNKQINGRRKKVVVPLEHQPDSRNVVKLHRAYSKHTLDESYR